MSTSSAVTPPVPPPFGDSVVVTSRWQVSGRHAQRAAADTTMARWERLPWPGGCVSVDCLLSTDGRIVLFYSKWTDEQSFRRHASSAEGDVTPLETLVSRPASPPIAHPAAGPFPGCVAVVIIETDGADRQRQAAARIASIGAEAHPGALGGQISFGVEGDRVILYAEWTSEEAHREAVAGSAFGGQRGIFDGTPGIRGLSVDRYQLYRSAKEPG